ncbi:SDR family oxidoreductase [Streptococcus merionis]|uniref:SDR family oxidoreductase n=1 Tax=Streptococcus merionis TaxID=400065 RepID=UPI0026EBCE54|nr:SDR family oxidoreductase [Streptococcus merionis]
MKLTITAATGQLGRYITTEAIQTFGAGQVRLAVRTPQKAENYAEQGTQVVYANYDDYESLVTAFADTDVLIYIPSITHPSIKRVPEVERVVQAAENAHVKHFIFASFFADQENSPFHMAPFFGYATRRLACSKLSYTVLKNAMYADPLVPYLPELQAMGKLIYPAPNGRMSFISRADSAKAIVKVAATPECWGKSYVLTQSQSYSMVEIAELLSRVGGKSIVFDPVTVEEFAAKYDQPAGFGVVLASLYQAAEVGLLSQVSDDFEFIMGYPAENLVSYLERQWQRYSTLGGDLYA